MTNGSAMAFAALGDPTRRGLLERMAGGHRSVGELAADLPITRPAVSQHLKVLRDAGLVAVEQRGTRRLYRLEAKGMQAMRRWLEAMWSEALDAFAQEFEGGEDER